MILSADVKLAREGFTLEARFEAATGVTVLFGPSGSGKTTLLNAIAGLQTPDTGIIRFNDNIWFDAETNRPAYMRKVGYVFQDGRLFPHMTVRENICYSQNHRLERLDEIIDLLGIIDLLDRAPLTLSGGERQRVAIARALLSDPDILCMDEPLSALDGPRRMAVLPYIERIAQAAKIPVIYVTHDVAELSRLADQVVLMDQGKIAAIGPVAAVLSDPRNAQYFGGRNLGAVLNTQVGTTTDGLTDLYFAGGTLRLSNIHRPAGTALRLRIAAQDVILSLDQPKGISALNVLPVQIENIADLTEGKLITLTLGATRILAKVTQHSTDRLGLTKGQTVFAILKATAVDPVAMG